MGTHAMVLPVISDGRRGVSDALVDLDVRQPHPQLPRHGRVEAGDAPLHRAVLGPNHPRPRQTLLGTLLVTCTLCLEMVSGLVIMH